MGKVLNKGGYFDTLPQKSMGAGVLFFDEKGRILIVKPTYKEGWTIPGGVVDKDESPREACIREVREELGFQIGALKFICVDYMSPEASNYPTKTENLQFTFSGGILNSHQIKSIRLPENELSKYRFVEVGKALTLLRGNLARRLPACLDALKNKTGVYLEHGNIP